MLSTWCCCIPLRTGSIILGIAGVLGGFPYLIKGYTNWLYIIDGILHIVAYGVLLFGAFRYNKGAILAHLIASTILILVFIVFGLVSIFSISNIVPVLANSCKAIDIDLKQRGTTCDQFTTATIATGAAMFIIIGLAEVYFWICNYSFYLELKTGNKNPV